MQADTPCGFPYRMDNNRRRLADDPAAGVEQSKMQIAVFPPGECERFVKAAESLQNRASAKAIGRNELARFQARRVALKIGRLFTKGHDGLTGDGNDIRIREGPHSRGEPVAIGNAVVVGKGDDFTPGGLPTDVSGRCGAMPASSAS